MVARRVSPRLYGCMKTDANGWSELLTILPGSYPGTQVPAHIHFTLWGAGFPLQWVDELRFEGDRFITPAMLEKADGEGEFRTIQRLIRDIYHHAGTAVLAFHNQDNDTDFKYRLTTHEGGSNLNQLHHYPI